MSAQESKKFAHERGETLDDPTESPGSTPGQPTFDQALGNVIEAELNFRGFSLEELGANIISVERLQLIISGTSPVTAAELVFIAARLGTGINQLIHAAQRESNPPVYLRPVRKSVSPEEEAELLTDEQCLILELLAQGWDEGEVAKARNYISRRSVTSRVGHIESTLRRHGNLRPEDDLGEYIDQARSKGTPLGERLKKIGLGLDEKPTPSPERLKDSDDYIALTEEISQRVRELRQAHRWTQSLLGEELPPTHIVITQAQISQIETGSALRVPRFRMRVLAQRFGVPERELIEGGPAVDLIISEGRDRQEQEQRELESRDEEARREREATQSSVTEPTSQDLVSVDQEIARRIRRLRKAKGILARALADAASHKPPWASNLEGILFNVPYGIARGYRRDDIQKIADLLGVPLAVLLDRDGTSFYSLLKEFEDRPQQHVEQAKTEQQPAGAVATQPHSVAMHRPESSTKSAEIADGGQADPAGSIYVPQPIVRDQVGLQTGLRELIKAIPTPNFAASRGPWLTRYSAAKRVIKLTFIQVVRKRNLGKSTRRNVFYLGRLLWELPEVADFIDDFDRAMKRLQEDRVAIQKQVEETIAMVNKEGNGRK